MLFWWKFWFEKDKSTILNRMVRGGGRRRNRFKRVRKVFLRYFIVAVAVSAMIGVFGQIVLHSPTFLYDDLKVCPQVEMQCASSTTRNPMLRFAYARARSDLNVCVESISGEQQRILSRGDDESSSDSISFFSASEMALLYARAFMCNCCSFSIWFCISAISGEMTIVTPCDTRAGISQQSDFPPPVGSNTKQSLFWRAAVTISRCPGLEWNGAICYKTQQIYNYKYY